MMLLQKWSARHLHHHKSEHDVQNLCSVPEQVVRIFAFNNGQNGISSMPIQDPVGVVHEEALQRFDYVVATAGLIGIRLILTVNNHWEVREMPCTSMPACSCLARNTTA